MATLLLILAAACFLAFALFLLCYLPVFERADYVALKEVRERLRAAEDLAWQHLCGGAYVLAVDGPLLDDSAISVYERPHLTTWTRGRRAGQMGYFSGGMEGECLTSFFAPCLASRRLVRQIRALLPPLPPSSLT